MLPSQRGGWRCTRSWKGTQLGQVTPTTDQTGIQYHKSQQITRVKAGWRTLFGNWLGRISFFICITYFISLFVVFPFGIIYSFIIILFELWSCFYLRAWIYLVLLFQFSPPSHHLREWVAAWGLVASWSSAMTDVFESLVCFLLLLWCSFALPHVAVSGLLMCRFFGLLV